MTRRRLLPAIGRWFTVLVVGAVLAWAGHAAWRASRASLDWIAAKRAVVTWGSGVVEPAQWASTWQGLQRAVALEPENARIHELLGLVAARKFDDYAILEGATRHYLKSLSLRPISPITWANLAEARYLIGDTSRTFEVAVENAVRLGPSSPQTQRVVAHYGLAVIDEVRPSARKAIEAAVAAGMRRDPAEMIPIALRRGRLDVACRYLPESGKKVDPRWGRFCAR